MAKAKACLIRLDKIGDLISTLSADQSLSSDVEVKWVVNSAVEFIPRHSLPQRNFLSLNLKSKLSSFLKLFKFLKRERPNLVVIFYAPAWAYLASFLAGVPVRAGRLSSPISFLTLNRGLRQKRHLSQKHEAQYNWELIHHAIGKNLPSDLTAPVLKLAIAFDYALLQKWNLERKKYYIVHPGMTGSAMNWPEGHFRTLIEKLILTDVVVVTGTAADQDWLHEIAEKLKNHPQVRWTIEHLSTENLLMLLSEAKAVIAPSTGVLHLAASLGTPTLGLYSPVRSQHPSRWAQRSDNSIILVPNVSCPATQSCLGSRCQFFYCMNSISPNEVMKELFAHA